LAWAHLGDRERDIEKKRPVNDVYAGRVESERAGRRMVGRGVRMVSAGGLKAAPESR
jgi:hypothetical protein